MPFICSASSGQQCSPPAYRSIRSSASVFVTQTTSHSASRQKALGIGVRYVLGGTIFGLGWSMTGACPGPLVALVGAGMPVMLVAILSALIGTWTYGALRPRLSH